MLFCWAGGTGGPPVFGGVGIWGNRFFSKVFCFLGAARPPNVISDTFVPTFVVSGPFGVGDVYFSSVMAARPPTFLHFCARFCFRWAIWFPSALV